MGLPLDATTLIGTISKFHNGDSKSSYIPISKSFPHYSASPTVPSKFSDKFILSEDFDRDCEESIARFRNTYHLYNIVF